MTSELSKLSLTKIFAKIDSRAALLVLLIVQILCSFFFLADITADLFEGGPAWHLMPELGATLGLLIGIGVEVAVFILLLRRQAHLQQSLGVAAGALAEVMRAHFREWGLTPSEEDVAAFAIKGCSIAEIATLRGSAEGTVKTHLNAIYRKAGVQGRSQLVSLLIEDLLNTPLIEGATVGRGVVSAPIEAQ